MPALGHLTRLAHPWLCSQDAARLEMEPPWSRQARPRVLAGRDAPRHVKARSPAPLLIVVSGPSGSGKGEALKVLAEEGLERVVTYTTRAPRPGERDGVDYHFVNEEEFQERYAAEELLEYNRTYQEYAYASPSAVLAGSSSLPEQVMELDPEGYFYVRANALRRVVGIFTLPPSILELDRRIRLRARSSEQDLERRLAVARKQIILAWQYDFVVTNTDLERFRDDLRAIARALRSHQRSLIDLGELVASIRNAEVSDPAGPIRCA